MYDSVHLNLSFLLTLAPDIGNRKVVSPYPTTMVFVIQLDVVRLIGPGRVTSFVLTRVFPQLVVSVRDHVGVHGCHFGFRLLSVVVK